MTRASSEMIVIPVAKVLVCGVPDSNAGHLLVELHHLPQGLRGQNVVVVRDEQRGVISCVSREVDVQPFFVFNVRAVRRDPELLRP